MKPAIKWNRPVVERFHVVRTSKCGRYKITTRMMSKMSGKPGCFTTRVFEPLKDGKRIGGRDMQESLADAKIECEMDNNPDWEPE